MIGYSPIGVTPIGAIAAATASQNATAPGASLVATSSMVGGAAVGAAAGIASGAQLIATSSMSPGSASGSRSATANGAVLVASSAMAPGAASGSRAAIASGAALVASSSMAPGAAIGGSSGGTIPGVVTVPASRTAKFAANPRAAVFNTTRPVSLTKGALDELWFVGDFTKDLTDAATTAVSVVPVSAAVVVLEGPSLQGALGLVKLGAMSSGSASFTFRVTCANGEVFDRTILLTAVEDRLWVFGKDPDDQRFYAFDFAADLALSANTALASVGTPVVVGVSALSAPGIQGSQVVMKFGGLSAGDAVNSCGLPVTFANGEKIYRSIYFTREDH